MAIVESIRVLDRFEGVITDFDDMTIASEGYFSDLTQLGTDADHRLVNGNYDNGDAMYDIDQAQDVGDDTLLFLRTTVTHTTSSVTHSRRYIFSYTSSTIYDPSSYDYLSEENIPLIRFEMGGISSLDFIASPYIWAHRLLPVTTANTVKGDLLEMFGTEEDFSFDIGNITFDRIIVKGNWTDDPYGLEKDVWYTKFLTITVTEDTLINTAGRSVTGDDSSPAIWFHNGLPFTEKMIMSGEQVSIYQPDLINMVLLDLKGIPHNDTESIISQIKQKNEKYAGKRTVDQVLLLYSPISCDDTNASAIQGDLAFLTANRIYTDVIQVDTQINSIAITAEIQPESMVVSDSFTMGTLTDVTAVTLKGTGPNVETVISNKVSSADTLSFDIGTGLLNGDSNPIPLTVVSDGSLTVRVDLSQDVQGNTVQTSVVVDNSDGCYAIVPSVYTTYPHRKVMGMIASDDFTLDTTVSVTDGIWVVGLKEVNGTVSVKKGEWIELFSTTDDFNASIAGMKLERFISTGNWLNKPLGVNDNVEYVRLLSFTVSEDITIDTSGRVTADSGTDIWLYEGNAFQSVYVEKGGYVEVYHTHIANVSEVNIGAAKASSVLPQRKMYELNCNLLLNDNAMSQQDFESLLDLSDKLYWNIQMNMEATQSDYIRTQTTDEAINFFENYVKPYARMHDRRVYLPFAITDILHGDFNPWLVYHTIQYQTIQKFNKVGNEEYTAIDARYFDKPYAVFPLTNSYYEPGACDRKTDVNPLPLFESSLSLDCRSGHFGGYEERVSDYLDYYLSDRDVFQINDVFLAFNGGKKIVLKNKCLFTNYHKNPVNNSPGGFRMHQHVDTSNFSSMEECHNAHLAKVIYQRDGKDLAINIDFDYEVEEVHIMRKICETTISGAGKLHTLRSHYYGASNVNISGSFPELLHVGTYEATPLSYLSGYNFYGSCYADFRNAPKLRNVTMIGYDHLLGREVYAPPQIEYMVLSQVGVLKNIADITKAGFRYYVMNRSANSDDSNIMREEGQLKLLEEVKNVNATLLADTTKELHISAEYGSTHYHYPSAEAEAVNTAISHNWNIFMKESDGSWFKIEAGTGTKTYV